MQLRRYRYKLKVRSKGKKQKLWKFAGAYRLIYNLGLLQREFLWWQRRERSTYAKQCAELVELKKEFSWLCEVHYKISTIIAKSHGMVEAGIPRLWSWEGQKFHKIR